MRLRLPPIYAKEKEKPPVRGLIERGGEAVIRHQADVKQATIEPVTKATIAAGSQMMADEYDI